MVLSGTGREDAERYLGDLERGTAPLPSVLRVMVPSNMLPSGFNLHIVLITATIYYYGIDTKTYEPKVTKLSYSQADDCFYIDNEVHDCHIKAFEKEVIKEALYLKNNAQ